MLLYFIIPFAGHNFLSFFSVSFGISFEHAVQLPFTVFLYSPFPDNYAFLSLSPSQIKNIQSADTVPVHGHSPLVCPFLLSASEYLSNMLFSYHLLYFCTALSLIIMFSSHYHHHKSKTFSQLTQCPFTGTLLLFKFWQSSCILPEMLLILKTVRDTVIWRKF